MKNLFTILFALIAMSCEAQIFIDSKSPEGRNIYPAGAFARTIDTVDYYKDTLPVYILASYSVNSELVAFQMHGYEVCRNRKYFTDTRGCFYLDNKKNRLNKEIIVWDSRFRNE